MESPCTNENFGIALQCDQSGHGGSNSEANEGKMALDIITKRQQTTRKKQTATTTQPKSGNVEHGS